MRTIIIDGIEYLIVEMKRHDTEIFFTDVLEAEKFAYKKIWVDANKITGDRSYTRVPLDVVAEDDKRIQVIADILGIGKRLVVLIKNEHNIDIAKTR